MSDLTRRAQGNREHGVSGVSGGRGGDQGRVHVDIAVEKLRNIFILSMLVQRNMKQDEDEREVRNG